VDPDASSDAVEPSGSTASTASTGPDPSPTRTSAPETGDLVIDAALRDLAEAPEDDLDAQVERGEQVQRTLQGRLSDLGG
jgi:hypothetical protein